MKYYWITESINTVQIGKYPQSEKCFTHGDIYKIDYENVVETLINIPQPILNNKSNITSCFTNTAINYNLFLILKNDFLSFLNDFISQKYKTWKMKVHYKKEIIDDYELFYLVESKQKEYIDFRNSEFYIGSYKDYKWIGDSVEIINYENLLATKATLKKEKLTIKAKKIVFNLSNAKDDLFRIDNIVPIIGTMGYYISEKLKCKIEENGFTGMEFIEISELDKVRVI